MPASYGFGLAYRHSDRLTFSLDLYRTEWSEFAITSRETGEKKNPISNQPIGKGTSKDTTQVRLGIEYLFIGSKIVIPLRAGLFYDPEPSMRKTRAQSAGSASDDSTWEAVTNNYFGFSVGSGISVDSWAFDVSYQYRFGNRVSSDLNLQNTSMDTTQHTILASLIYHF
jgi:long-subunit fatty acid transport protein